MRQTSQQFLMYNADETLTESKPENKAQVMEKDNAKQFEELREMLGELRTSC